MKKALQVVDPKSIVSEMEKNMPEWVKEIGSKEDMGNAIYATSSEMLIAIDDVLLRYFKFTEVNIKEFHRHLEDLLTGAKEFETHGLTIMTPHSMGVIGKKIEKIGISGLLEEIAQIRFTKEKMIRAGIEYPVSLKATPFIKQIGKK